MAVSIEQLAESIRAMGRAARGQMELDFESARRARLVEMSYEEALRHHLNAVEAQRSAASLRETEAEYAAYQKSFWAPDVIDTSVWPFCRCLDPVVYGHKRACHGPLAGTRE